MHPILCAIGFFSDHKKKKKKLKNCAGYIRHDNEKTKVLNSKKTMPHIY
jgi:hypothetical protein